VDIIKYVLITPVFKNEIPRPPVVGLGIPGEDDSLEILIRKMRNKKGCHILF